jgi:phosphomannomutase
VASQLIFQDQPIGHLWVACKRGAKRLQAATTQRVKDIYTSQPGVTTDELDGLTVSGDTWWFNLRPSNTEPLLRLNVEAADEIEMAALRDEVLGLVRGTSTRSE